MDVEKLKNSIMTLKKVRDVHNSRLDTSLANRLDEVITDLEIVISSEQSDVDVSQISFRVLQVIGDIVSLVCNIKDLF